MLRLLKEKLRLKRHRINISKILNISALGALSLYPTKSWSQDWRLVAQSENGPAFYIDSSSIKTAGNNTYSFWTKSEEQYPSSDGLDSNKSFRKYNCLNKTSLLDYNLDFNANGEVIGQSSSSRSVFYPISPGSIADEMFKYICEKKPLPIMYPHIASPNWHLVHDGYKGSKYYIDKVRFYDRNKAASGGYFWLKSDHRESSSDYNFLDIAKISYDCSKGTFQSKEFISFNNNDRVRYFSRKPLPEESYIGRGFEEFAKYVCDRIPLP